MRKNKVRIFALLGICISICCLFLIGCDKAASDNLEVISFPLPDGPQEAEINIDPIQIFLMISFEVWMHLQYLFWKTVV